MERTRKPPDTAALLKRMEEPVYDDELLSFVYQASSRLQDRLVSGIPGAAVTALCWIERISPTERIADRILAAEMFPFVLLPWWLTNFIPKGKKGDFFSDLVYASISAYYHIRLIDDVMDHEPEAPANLLPAVGFFQMETFDALLKHFAPTHEFWQTFRTHWYRALEASIVDADRKVFDRETFDQVASQKTSASKIGICAVCYKNDRSDLIPEWTRLCTLFGRFHQMLDDLVDWRDDARANRSTYFLSQSERQRLPGESTFSWFLREGFQWGIGELENIVVEQTELVQRLGCLELETYLDSRVSAFTDWAETLQKGTRSLNELEQKYKSEPIALER